MIVVAINRSHKDRSKEKLKNFVENEVTKLFTGVLDYAEVAIDGKERWKGLRSRILKLSNDTIRELKKELDNHYEINYVNPPGEDIIVVSKGK